jgi:hypothetical protein
MFRRFLYYLLDKDGKSFLINNGVVSKTAQPTPLPETPDGWQDIEIGYERDMNKLGVVRQFTLPISLIYAALTIIRTIVLSLGRGEKVYLLIQKLSVEATNTYYSFIYKYLYKGLFNLSSYQYNDVKDNLSITEGGIYQKIKAKEGTSFEIDIDSDPEKVVLEHDGIILNGSYTWVLPEDGAVSGQNVRAMVKIGEEQNAPGVAALDVYGGGLFDPNALTVNNTEYFLDFSIPPVDGTGRLFGTIELSVPLSGFPANQYLKIFNTVTDTTRDTINLFVGDEQAIIDFDITVNVQKGDRFFLQIDEPILESKITFTCRSRYTKTNLPCLKPSTVLKRLIEKITGSALNCDTTFIQQFDHLLLTSGDGIRSLAGSKIKTSLTQFSEFVRVIMAGGQGIENDKLLFNDFSYFLKETNPVSLGNVANFKGSWAKDLLIKNVKVGYPVKQIDDVNGKASFHNTVEYTSPDDEAEKELNLVCPYPACPYYIESLRINLEGKTTTDDKADNEVFILNSVENKVSFTVPVMTSFEFIVTQTFAMGDVNDKAPFLKPGMKITISGAAINNRTFTIRAVVIISPTQIWVSVEEPTDLGSMDGALISFSSYTLRRETYTSVTGIPDPDTIYNIEDLTPLRIRDRHEAWINSCLWGFAGKKLKWETTEKNADLVIVKNGVTYKEKSDYIIKTVILFKPFEFEFDCPVPHDLIDTLEIDPNTPFTPVWYDLPYTGILRKAGIAPANNKAQSYKLLCAPGTDLTGLI